MNRHTGTRDDGEALTVPGARSLPSVRMKWPPPDLSALEISIQVLSVPRYSKFTSI